MELLIRDWRSEGDQIFLSDVVVHPLRATKVLRKSCDQTVVEVVGPDISLDVERDVVVGLPHYPKRNTGACQ